MDLNNQLMINHLKAFNKQDTLLIISEYARAKEGKTGLSTFSNNTVQSLLKKQNSSTARAVILADKEKKAKTSFEYEDENRLIVRCFHRDQPLSILYLTSLIIKLNKIKTVLIEFEFASFGEPFSLMFFLIMLFFIKLTGKNSFFVLHQVVTDLNGLKHQLGDKRKNVLRFLTFLLRLFYRMLGFLNTKIILTEEEFKDRLSHYVSANKIVCIPHGVEYVNNQPAMGKGILKEKFGCADSDYIIMIFGYIAWYKGVLEAIRAIKNVPSTLYGKKIRLVIAGGESNTQRNKKHYQKYYQEILNAAKNDQRVVITGFVPNQAIPAFFKRADFIVRSPIACIGI